MGNRHSNFYPDFFRRTPRRHRRDAVYNWNDEADFLRIDQVSCFGPMLQQDEELVRAGPAIPRVTRCTVELARSATSAYRSQQGTSQPSAGTSQMVAERRVRRPQCGICGVEIDGAILRIPECGHVYDVECLTHLFETAIRNESLFPPKCPCGPAPIQFDVLRPHHPDPDSILHLLREKAEEFGTRDRVYCHNCSTFIGPATDRAFALICYACGERTCGHCQARAHRATDMCNTREDERVLRMATDHGWKQCPQCRHVVELGEGCNHITCRCGHQFCYVCTAQWKTCGCPQYPVRGNDAPARRLRNANVQAIAAVPRQANHNPPPPAPPLGLPNPVPQYWWPGAAQPPQQWWPAQPPLWGVAPGDPRHYQPGPVPGPPPYYYPIPPVWPVGLPGGPQMMPGAHGYHWA